MSLLNEEENGEFTRIMAQDVIRLEDLVPFLYVEDYRRHQAKMGTETIEFDLLSGEGRLEVLRHGVVAVDNQQSYIRRFVRDKLLEANRSFLFPSEKSN